jgi:hypothetical protein
MPSISIIICGNASAAPSTAVEAGCLPAMNPALALCFGWEAFVVLKDVRGLDNAEGERVCGWAARSLLRAALDDRPPPPTP